jgi:hypothetical protein
LKHGNNDSKIVSETNIEAKKLDTVQSQIIQIAALKPILKPPTPKKTQE